MAAGMDSFDAPTNGKEAGACDPGSVTFLHGQVPPTEPLPRGQHDLSAEYVAAHQRTRILEATTFVLSERGYGPATIGDIVARAHVSRRTFYDHFETKDHCVLACFAAATECIADAVRTAYTGADGWAESMAAGLAELMRVLVHYPHTARTCFLEVRSVGAAAEEPLAAARAMCSDALYSALADRPGSRPATPLEVEMGLGGLLALVRARLAADRPQSLQADLPVIAHALLRPLAGDEAASTVASLIDAAPEARAAHAI